MNLEFWIRLHFQVQMYMKFCHIAVKLSDNNLKLCANQQVSGNQTIQMRKLLAIISGGFPSHNNYNDLTNNYYSTYLRHWYLAHFQIKMLENSSQATFQTYILIKRKNCFHLPKWNPKFFYLSLS